MGAKIDLCSAVTVCVDAMLPKFSGERVALVMGLDVRVRKSGKNWGVPYKYRKVNLMFVRPSSATIVLWHSSEDDQRHTSLRSWEVKADHDFLWRNEGVAQPLDELVATLVSEIGPDIQASECDIESSFNTMGEPRLVTLNEYVHDKDNRIFHVGRYGTIQHPKLTRVSGVR